MADTPLIISRRLLMDLCNLLRERTEDAETWRARIGEQDHEHITSHEPAELANFLTDLATDLGDWRHLLQAIVGDGDY